VQRTAALHPPLLSSSTGVHELIGSIVNRLVKKFERQVKWEEGNRICQSVGKDGLVARNEWLDLRAMKHVVNATISVVI
jgi:hypothetical protein